MEGISEVTSAHLAGDAGAWEKLVNEHQTVVFRFAYLLLGDAADAEDVAQETFINAFRAIHRFDTSRGLRPWLLGICANGVRNRKRGWMRYVNALRNWFANQPAQASIAEQGEQNLQSERLWTAVRYLKEQDQQVIYLRYFLELDEAEMAGVLNVARGTVKSRLSRALLRLREVIQRDFRELGMWVE